MGYRAGSDDDYDKQAEREAEETAGAAADDTAAPGAAMKTLGSKRGIFLLLGGLVVAGIAAGWNWMRDLPKDEQ